MTVVFDIAIRVRSSMFTAASTTANIPKAPKTDQAPADVFPRTILGTVMELW
jgi:hypothetical protein